MEDMEKLSGMEATELSEEELNAVDGGAVQFRVPPAKRGFIVYQISKGDTLGRIALHFGCTIKDLMSWNPYITDMNKIYSGAYLYIRE